MTSRERYDAAKKEEWASLCEAILSGEHVDCPKWKRNAIRWARETGCSQESIIGLGQSKVLSNYTKAQREGRIGGQKLLRWRVSSTLADAVMSSNTSPDQEEALVSRLVRVGKLRTSEDFWNFILSAFADLSDEDIKHLAGECDGDS